MIDRMKLRAGLLGIVICLAAIAMGSGAFHPAHGKTAPAAAEKHAAVPAWAIRCAETPADKAKNKPAAKYCEVFQRIDVAKTGQRVVELAVGFPEKGDNARGVLILPLGLVLTDDLQLQVDKTQTFKFKVRFCTGEGCFAFLDLGKPALDILKNGKTITIAGRAYSGQPVVIKLDLAGFAKLIKQL